MERFRSCLFRHLFMRFISLKIAFALTRDKITPFYLMRDLILGIDIVLSYGIRLLLLITMLRLIFFKHINLPLINGGLLILLVIFYCLIKINKQEKKKYDFRPFLIDDINIGSAKLLKGQILIGHVFLNNLDYIWDSQSIEETQEKMTIATEWLEKQAILYSVKLSVKNRWLSVTIEPFDHPIPTHKNYFQHKKDFERILHPVFECLLKEVAESEIPFSSYCLMVHSLESIRAYAVPVTLGTDKVSNSVEYCICTKSDFPAVYAHETLHLFGADDFYAEYNKKLHEYRREFLKGSIMFATGSLDDVQVDALTAQNIGWL